MSAAELFDLSVVLACYNEEGIIEHTLPELCRILDSLKYRYEILAVDDCSNDKTRQLIDDFASKNPGIELRRIYNKENSGKGFTVSEGLRQSRGRIAGYIDVDLEISAHYIPAFAAAIDNGYDVATACRTYKLRWYLISRYISSKIFVWLTKSLLKVPFSDTQAGMKFFKRAVVLPVLDRVVSRHWFWDTEIIALCYYENMKIRQIPVLFSKRNDKKSKVNLLRDGISQFISLCRFRRRACGYLNAKYKK